MIVCLCHRVTDRDIAREAGGGCADFEALQERLLVGTACGACGDCAQAVFNEHCASANGAGWRPVTLNPRLVSAPA